MSANNAKIQSVIETAFLSAINKLSREEGGNLISDLYVQVDPENGELQVYGEDEVLLGKTVIFDWLNSRAEEEQFNKQVAATIKAVLTVLSTKDTFNHPCFLKPFSVSLTDEDFFVIEELLFIDDDLLRLDDPLLKDLDSELDEFLSKLLSDVE